MQVLGADRTQRVVLDNKQLANAVSGAAPPSLGAAGKRSSTLLLQNQNSEQNLGDAPVDEGDAEPLCDFTKGS